MNEEEKKVVESLKYEYKNMVDNDYVLFPLYKTQANKLINLIDKLQKENKNLKICLEREEKYSQSLNEDIKSLLNIEPNTNFISKDKIRELIKELVGETQYLGKDRGETKQHYAIRILKKLLGE